MQETEKRKKGENVKGDPKIVESGNKWPRRQKPGSMDARTPNKTRNQNSMAQESDINDSTEVGKTLPN
jgi:hypothetical protein